MGSYLSQAYLSVSESRLEFGLCSLISHSTPLFITPATQIHANNADTSLINLGNVFLPQTQGYKPVATRSLFPRQMLRLVPFFFHQFRPLQLGHAVLYISVPNVRRNFYSAFLKKCHFGTLQCECFPEYFNLNFFDSNVNHYLGVFTHTLLIIISSHLLFHSYHTTPSVFPF